MLQAADSAQLQKTAILGTCNQCTRTGHGEEKDLSSLLRAVCRFVLTCGFSGEEQALANAREATARAA